MSAQERLEECLRLLNDMWTPQYTDAEPRLIFSHGTESRASLIVEAEFWLKMIGYERSQEWYPS